MSADAGSTMSLATTDATPGLPVPFGDDLARAIVADAVARYLAARRAAIPAFVERNFGLRGAAELHRRALGWDLLRAPANLVLALPDLFRRLGASGSRRLGWHKAAGWLAGRSLFYPSAVGRELEWRIMTELLVLPYAQPGRGSTRDALADEIFRDERIGAALLPVLQQIGRRGDDPGFRGWLTETLETYAGTRVAAADLANGLLSLGAGAVGFKKWTPGALSLGPLLAQVLMHKAAVLSFPLGAGIGGFWYGLFPIAPSAVLTAGVTTGLIVLPAVFGAVSGVVTDPIQAKLGLHRRRLERLVDTLERELIGMGDSRYAVPDHYAARLLDLLDVLRAVYRHHRA